MRSKIIFLLAIMVAVLWLLIFSLFSKDSYIHLLAVIALALLALSYAMHKKQSKNTTKNDDEN